MKVAVLTGGVGGAKLVLGLQACGEVEQLTAIVNTGDDFRHLGLAISPDIDTLLYALSGQDNKTQGWGREGESWSFMAALKSLGGPAWFNLGDGDLALHVLRSEALAQGQTLAEVTDGFAKAWGIATTILPMSNDSVATIVETAEGPLAFQNYFVEKQCAPAVTGVRFEDAQSAQPAPGVVEALSGADAILIAPSNPWLSVDPLLSVAGIAKALRASSAPVIAVSPLIGGKAVKGPTSKLMVELGITPDNNAIAEHYAGLIDGLLCHEGDTLPSNIATRTTDTLMSTLDDRIRVAQAALEFACELRC